MKTDKKSTKISENYSIRKDRYQWILIEHYLAEGLDGKQKELASTSYHSTLEQVAKYMINNNEQHSLDGYIVEARAVAEDIRRNLSYALEADNEKENT